MFLQTHICPFMRDFYLFLADRLDMGSSKRQASPSQNQKLLNFVRNTQSKRLEESPSESFLSFSSFFILFRYGSCNWVGYASFSAIHFKLGRICACF